MQVYNMKKLKVAILFGGKSVEHEVSIQSAKNVDKALREKKYDVVLIGIDKKGNWHKVPSDFLLKTSEQLHSFDETLPQSVKTIENVDVVFPVLHGPMGEDGTIQGMLKVLDIPFVGAGVVGSAVSMDKDVAKRLLRDADIPQAKFLTLRADEKISLKRIEKALGFPMFVKPANLGSSVGVSKATDEIELKKAIGEAFLYDTKIVVEEEIVGDEIFCSLLGNDKVLISAPGKLITDHTFYDYAAKYVDAIEMEIPAKLSPETMKQIQDISRKAYRVLCCDGMARTDLFVTKNGEIYFGEINTIPGFTSHSWYPKLWDASGICYTDLIEKLIMLAREKYTTQKMIKQSV